MLWDKQQLNGKTLGNCTLTRMIGRGGMGAVYLAEQLRPARNVAVKILLPPITSDPQIYQEFLTRFRREADVIAKLEHINIIPVYEYGEQDGIAYLVMPYLPGGSLRGLLMRRGAIPLRETVPLVDQASSALDYAHSHNVIHRDLKPDNFLFHADGRLVLTDFGIARILQGNDDTQRHTLTGTGAFLGTPEYMAPEMVLGEKVDHRADIYGLGIVLFQMLSGQVPFKGNTPMAVATKHLQEAPPQLHTDFPAIPPTVDAVIQIALAKKREDRFATAGVLARALHNAISTDGVSPPDILDTSTVLSPARVIPPTIAVSPPAQQLLHAQRASAPVNLSADPVREQNKPTYPDTPYPVSQKTPRLQPWLVFISLLLVLLLVTGGILLGLQLNRGAGTTNVSNSTSHSQNTPVTVSPGTQTTIATVSPQPTTQPVTRIPLGSLLYTASSPGPCDSGAGSWITFNNPSISCLPNGTTEIQNSHTSAQLAGIFLDQIPNQSYPTNYVIQVQLQTTNASTADFGIYFRNQPGNQQGVYTFLIHSDVTWTSYVYDNTTGASSTLTTGSLGNVSGLMVIDVAVIGSHFSFYVDKQLVGTANNTAYSSGTAGIAVDEGGTILASSFALYLPAT